MHDSRTLCVDDLRRRHYTKTWTMKARIHDGVLHSAYPHCDIPRCSIYNLIKDYVGSCPDRVALVDDTISLTLSELFVQLRRYAAGFQSLGVKPGDHVCVHVSTSVTNYVAMLGCVFAGATIVPAKPSLTERELIYHMRDSDATHVLTETQFSDKILAASSKLNLKGLYLVGKAPGFVSIDGFPHIDEAIFTEVPVFDPANTLAALVYTSGSTGLPKGVEFTHQSVVAAACVFREHAAAGGVEVRLGWNPITHSSGFVLPLAAVVSGDTCVLTSAPSLSRLVDVVNKFGVTFIYFFPTLLQSTVKQMQETGTRLPSVRRIAVGGGQVSESLVRDTLRAFENLRELMNTYAMTEACGLLTATPRWCTAYRGLGFPASTVKIKVVDVRSGRKLGPRQSGELCFKSLSTARGYYKRSEATAELLDSDGWCHCGDLVYYDEDGTLHYVSRIKDMIKCMDKQIAPAELEAILLKEFDAIQEVVVVGIPHPDYGEAPAAVVVVKGTQNVLGTVTEDRIKETICRTCADFKHLHGGVYFVDQIPKTENGKILRQNLLQGIKA